MASFLSRYLDGEHGQVWAELLALGEYVREEPLYSDALAVARETMNRVRYNIELLIPRLKDIGYEFGCYWLVAYNTMQDFPGADDWAGLSEGDRKLLMRKLEEFIPLGPPPFIAPKPEVHDFLAELGDMIYTIPLSVRAWCEIVGDVDLRGSASSSWENMGLGGVAAYSKFAHLHSYNPLEWEPFYQQHPEFADEDYAFHKYGLDPLEVTSLKDGLRRYKRIMDEGVSEGKRWPLYRLLFSGDYLHKFNISGGGGYEIGLPGAAADGLVRGEWHNTTFINYLRICFRWGGFPGLEHAKALPLKDLAYLTEGLLPI